MYFIMKYKFLNDEVVRASMKVMARFCIDDGIEREAVKSNNT